MIFSAISKVSNIEKCKVVNIKIRTKAPWEFFLNSQEIYIIYLNIYLQKGINMRTKYIFIAREVTYF